MVLLCAPVVGEGTENVADGANKKVEATGDGVPIRLSRPLRAGQVFSYAAVGRGYHETVVSTDGAVVNQTVDGVRCELAAALAVDAVREDGKPLELSVRIFRLVVREGFLPAEQGGAVNAGEQPLKSGTEIKVRYPSRGAGEPDLLLAAGGELDGDLIKALRLVLPGPAGTRDDDALFGKPGMARVGERWPVAAPEVIAALAEGGIEVPEGKLEGEAGVVTHDPETKTHVIEVSLVGDTAGVPLPKGYITRAGTLKVRLRSTLPDQATGAPVRESAEYSLHSQAMGREGDRLMVVDLAFFDSRTANYREVTAETLKPSKLGASN